MMSINFNSTFFFQSFIEDRVGAQLDLYSQYIFQATALNKTGVCTVAY